MAVILAPGESVDAAYRRFIREMAMNDTFKQLEENRYHIRKGLVASDKRRQFNKTKRKRAQARRKMKK